MNLQVPYLDLKTWTRILRIGPWFLTEITLDTLKPTQYGPPTMAYGGKTLAGQNPANLLIGCEGKVGEKLEEVASYLGRGLVGVGAAGEVLAGVRLSSEAATCGGGGVPMGERRQGEAVPEVG